MLLPGQNRDNTVFPAVFPARGNRLKIDKLKADFRAQKWDKNGTTLQNHCPTMYNVMAFPPKKCQKKCVPTAHVKTRLVQRCRRSRRQAMWHSSSNTPVRCCARAHFTLFLRKIWLFPIKAVSLYYENPPSLFTMLKSAGRFVLLWHIIPRHTHHQLDWCHCWIPLWLGERTVVAIDRIPRGGRGWK